MKRFFILILVIVYSCSFQVYADEVVLNATPNPDYIQYINTAVSLSDDNSNYQPPFLSLVSPATLQSSELPASYDARTDGKIYYSGVGQKSDGTCWAFASTLCTETALGGKIDLSEQHAKYTMSNTGGNTYGYKRTPSGGGNFKMYTAYATSWRGVVSEEDDPYTYGNSERDYKTVTAAKPVSYHVQETIEIPNPQVSALSVTPQQRSDHINEVKYYVYKYGCCFSSIYWYSGYKSDDGKSYYNHSDSSPTNHAVCIIGWDDNYSKDNFKAKPQNNGAFIVKNSQGDTGEYYYVSYEDIYAAWDASCIVTAEDKYNYGDIYTYNNYEPAMSINITGQESFCTNVFESRFDGEYISAVGTLTKTRNMFYNVYVSVSDDGTDPTMDSYQLVATGSFEMPGYHTVKLDKPFYLGDAGTKYCVRFAYNCNGNPYEVPMEFPLSSNGIAIEKVDSNPMQCHFLCGTTYFDMGKTYNSNLFINAYTDADYDVSFCGGIQGTFSINGSKPAPCSGSIKAGLNDEITINFENTDPKITAYFINDTQYCTTDSVTLKITEPLEITAEKKAEITVASGNETLTLDTFRNLSDRCLVNITADFTEEHTVYAALYSGNRLAGIKQLNINTKNVETEIPFSHKPDKIKLITADKQLPLTPILKAIESEI